MRDRVDLPRRLPRLAAGVALPGIAQERLRSAVAGRTVLVTGASSGIGEASARRLAAAGATVVLVARREPLLRAVERDIAAAGGRAAVYPADLAAVDEVRGLVTELLADGLEVDVVVSNAGRSIRRSVEDSYDRFHDYTRTMDINYLGPVQLLLGLLPGMRRRGRGHIVNVSTIGVDLPSPYWSAYSASKNAFETWLRCVAPEARSDGVTTTSIHFGLVHTAMSAPTELFTGVPGMTPREAAGTIARAIVKRPRVIRPWWSALSALSAEVAPGLTDVLLTASYRNEQRIRAVAAHRRSRSAGSVE